jgi:biofilm PGA synthesis N-glycosyltransferase PgaC
MTSRHEPRADPARPLRIVCIVSFLNEERHLQRFLDSIQTQRRPPDELLLVDDGSSDESPRIAEEFAHSSPDARFLRRPRRPPARDRLADGAVVRAFQWALSQGSEPWDVAVKMDADLELSPDLFATLEQAFQAQDDLGIAGTYLTIVDPETGERRRERCPPHHVRGPTKSYRRACYEQIAPLPAMLGWDTIDEITARRHGWQTASLACPAGDTTHLRPTGAHDGLLRAQFRWGKCAYAIGQHPAWVAASAIRRLSVRPPALASAAFVAGWLAGFIQRWPRASPGVRAYGRSEQVRQLRRIGLALPRGPKMVRRAIQTAGAHER